MTFAINKAQYDGLPRWKQQGIRKIMGDLQLGTPAEYDASGVPVYVFQDERFTPGMVALLALGISGIVAMSEPPTGTTATDYNLLLTARNISPTSARFFDSVPAGWTPTEATT